MSKNIRKEVVVVTGGIGSGKSSVCQFFEDLGANVVSADLLARQASTEAISQIKLEFPSTVNSNGELDRKKLGQIVFANTKARIKLESILHPIIQKLADNEFKNAASKNSILIIYECPLFFETKMKKEDYRSLILVDAPRELCLKRATQRDLTDKNEINKRMLAQDNNDSKRVMADFIIENTGSIEELRSKVKEIFKKLVKTN